MRGNTSTHKSRVSTGGVPGWGLALLLACAGLLVACGGGSDSEITPNPNPSGAAPALADLGSRSATINAETTIAFANTGGAVQVTGGCALTSGALPGGLMIRRNSATPASCEIHGAPTGQPGTVALTITATNAAGSDTATVSIVTAAGQVGGNPPSLANLAARAFSTGIEIEPAAFVNSGDAVAADGCGLASGSTLPAGLMLRHATPAGMAATCEIHGIPTEELAAATYTIEASNGSGMGTATVEISVANPASRPVLANMLDGVSVATGSPIAPITLVNSGDSVSSRFGCRLVTGHRLPPGLMLRRVEPEGGVATCEIHGTAMESAASGRFVGIQAVNYTGSSVAVVYIAVGTPLLAFDVPPFPTVVDHGERTITFTAPVLSAIDALEPEILVAAGHSVSPASGAAADFGSPVVYTITPDSGGAITYTASALITPRLEALSPTEGIEGGYASVDGGDRREISFGGDGSFTYKFYRGETLLRTEEGDYEYGEVDSQSLLRVEIANAERASYGNAAASQARLITVEYDAAESASFSRPVRILQFPDGRLLSIRHDGINRTDFAALCSRRSGTTYTISCPISTLYSPIPEANVPRITAFSIGGFPAIIDQAAKAIFALVATGASVAALEPSIAASGAATVSPASGEAQDFASPVSYTVTEGDATATYTATVVAIDPVPVRMVPPKGLDGSYINNLAGVSSFGAISFAEEGRFTFRYHFQGRANPSYTASGQLVYVPDGGAPVFPVNFEAAARPQFGDAETLLARRIDLYYSEGASSLYPRPSRLLQLSDGKLLTARSERVNAISTVFLLVMPGGGFYNVKAGGSNSLDPVGNYIYTPQSSQ